MGGIFMGNGKSRRTFLAGGTAAVGGLLASCKKTISPSNIGGPRSHYGERSSNEKSVRSFWRIAHTGDRIESYAIAGPLRHYYPISTAFRAAPCWSPAN